MGIKKKQQKSLALPPLCYCGKICNTLVHRSVLFCNSRGPFCLRKSFFCTSFRLGQRSSEKVVEKSSCRRGSKKREWAARLPVSVCRWDSSAVMRIWVSPVSRILLLNTQISCKCACTFIYTLTMVPWHLHHSDMCIIAAIHAYSVSSFTKGLRGRLWATRQRACQPRANWFQATLQKLPLPVLRWKQMLYHELLLESVSIHTPNQDIWLWHHWCVHV